MSAKIKSLFSFVAALVVVVAGFNAPANATGESVNLVLTNDSLAGSEVTGFDPQATLRLAIISELGTVTWNNAGSGATIVSGSGTTAQGLWLSGTQAQLSAALQEVTINKPCAGSYKVHAQVTASGFLKNPVTGHLYKYNDQGKDLELALADAAATPLVTGGTSNFGYLATVTDSLENQLVNMFGQGWIGASDRVTEGDWKWMAGPEAGMSFYSGRSGDGGAALPGKFAGWGDGEPNDSGNEDYAEIYGDGRWNDSQDGGRNYVIEWGGMPGDDLSSVSVTEDFVDLSVAGVFTGNGTQADPYLVGNATDLRAVSSCGSASAYFEQTGTITLPANWAGDQNFLGHYDGDGNTISYSPGTVVTHNGFGVWANSGGSNSSVSNLTVTGNLVATSYSTVGLLFGDGAATLTNITVDGSITTSDGRGEMGGVAGTYSGNLTRVHSTVNLYSTSDGNSFGGLVGYYWGTMRNVSWDGEMNIGGTGETWRIGGLAGDIDCASIYDSKSSGTITVTNTAHGVGGLTGYFCGELHNSFADVDITATNSESVGGAVGYMNDYSDSVAAYGDVSGANFVGGLFGTARYGESSEVYARGNVISAGLGGSLVGTLNDFSIYRAYATGTVTASTSRGLFGDYNDSSTEKTHWVPSQSTVVEPSPLQSGEIPYTALESKDFLYYNYEGWGMDTVWAEGETWTICESINDGYPFITSFYRAEPCLSAQALTPTPTISGTGVEGDELTAEAGTWDAGVQLSFSWFAGSSIIPGANTTTFTPGADLVGQTITFKVISTKTGYQIVEKVSLGKLVSARAVIPTPSNLSITFGGFTANSWWVPTGFWKSIKAGVKGHKTATTITCVGIVAPGGFKSWQKKLGLNRAALACSAAKILNPNLKTKLSWKVAKASDAVQRGVTIKFNR